MLAMDTLSDGSVWVEERQLCLDSCIYMRAQTCRIMRLPCLQFTLSFIPLICDFG